jgi:predicted transcriptional regulator
MDFPVLFARLPRRLLLGAAAFAGVAGIAAVAAGLDPRLGWALAHAPALALYQRLQRDAALENPVRAKLYEAVARQPGITIQDAAEKVGIARTTASYHLRILGREGLVVERPARKSVHYYRNDGRYSEDDQLRLQALASERTRHVAKLLAQKPGLQRSELSRILGLSIATVNWHLRPLAERGLLREEPRGRRRLLFPTDAMLQCLQLLESGETSALPPGFDMMPTPASRGLPPA